MGLLELSRKARAVEQRKVRYALVFAAAMLLFLSWRTFF
jgi:hypothetical protein